MSDLSLMHHPDTYFNTVLTNHAETGYCGENPLAEAVMRSLFPIPLIGKADAFTVKTHVGSTCLREAVPQEEQLCVQESGHHNRGSLSAVSNACKMDHHSQDTSWDMGLPLVLDHATFPSENKHCRLLAKDRELAFCPSGSWNDDYSLSDDDGVSLYGEQLSYCSREDDSEGHFYFMPTATDFPQAFQSSTTLVLTIYDVPKHAEPEEELEYEEPECSEQKLKRELVNDEPKYAEQELKRELEYEDPEHAEPELKRELDLWGMIWQGLEKALAFGQIADNHPQAEEMHRTYAEREDSVNMLALSVRDGFEEAKTTPRPRGSSFSTPSTSRLRSSSSSPSSTSRHGRSSSSTTFRSLQNESKNGTNPPFTRSTSANMSSTAWRDGPKYIYTAPLTRSGTHDSLDEFFTASEADASPHYKSWYSKDLLQKIGPTTLDPLTSGKARQMVPGLVKMEMKQAPTSVDGSEVSRRTSRRQSTKSLAVDRSTRLKDPSRRGVTATPRRLPNGNLRIGVSRNV